MKNGHHPQLLKYPKIAHSLFPFLIFKMDSQPFDPESSSVECYPAYAVYKHSQLFSTNIWDYNVRIFPLQVSLLCVVSAMIHLLLRPLGETPVVAQLMAGIILGTSGLTKIHQFEDVVFPLDGGTFLIETLGYFGCMIYLFLTGVKMDLSVLKKSSRKERAIGILTFLLPILFTVPLSLIVQDSAPNYFAGILKIDPKMLNNLNLPLMAVMVSTTSFHAISCFLTDIKILNTELGRVGSSASTISGMCSLIMILCTLLWKANRSSHILTWIEYISSTLAQVIFIIVVLRKIVFWMIKNTPQGERVKNIYFFIIFIMVLGTGLIGETFGQHFIFGPMIFGLTIPNGPPLGSALEEKLDALTSGLFLPLYFSGIGYRVDVTVPEGYYWFTVIPIFVLSFLGKLIGTLIPCLFFQIPFKDALLLGLSLSTLGLVDVHYYNIALTSKIIEVNSFSILVVSALSLAGIIAPTVHFFYDPSRRYIIAKKRTIQNLKPNAELRLLVCIYNDENVPTIVNILQASNPTKELPIIIYLLHLIELTGRSTALLINHKTHGNNFSDSTLSGRIINSFKIFEQKYPDAIMLHPFTSMTPLLSAQEDICTLALERRTYFIIIPFHKQWNIDGTIQTGKWRNSNKRVLKQAPCSVGILIDRGVLKGTRSVLSSWSTFNVAVIFLGDADDREALCYGMRMAQNPNVYLTVYRLVLIDYLRDDVTEKMLDENAINEYKLNNKDIEHNLYTEDIVKDGVEMINVIRNMEKAHDLILVGRSHSNYHTLFSEFMEWNEYRELGFFGDMLASSDFTGNASVLIVQQHSSMQNDLMRDEAMQSYTTNTWR